MTLEEYIRHRFLRSNHTKYHKYFEEWKRGITREQLIYFEKEKERLCL